MFQNLLLLLGHFFLEPVNRTLVTRTLENRGHHVVTAEDGSKAVAAAKRERFDIVLMDLQMPAMDGFEATATIREWQKNTGARTPVVALTAHTMKGDRERCLEAGRDDYISKPIDNEELFRIIERLAIPASGNRRSWGPRPGHAVFDPSAR